MCVWTGHEVTTTPTDRVSEVMTFISLPRTPDGDIRACGGEGESLTKSHYDIHSLLCLTSNPTPTLLLGAQTGKTITYINADQTIYIYLKHFTATRAINVINPQTQKVIQSFLGNGLWSLNGNVLASRAPVVAGGSIQGRRRRYVSGEKFLRVLTGN